MNEEIITLYETYFQNVDNRKLFINEIPFHNCCFCSSEKILIIKHCKTDMKKYILMYLNHLKLISCLSWEKVKYFLKSIRISGFLANDCIGKWTMMKWEEKNIYILFRFE